MKKIRCTVCNKRIPDDESHYGREVYGKGKETYYHVDPKCGRFAFFPLKRGEVTIVHHYHSCGDEGSGFDCEGGCFLVDPKELVAVQTKN